MLRRYDGLVEAIHNLDVPPSKKGRRGVSTPPATIHAIVNGESVKDRRPAGACPECYRAWLDASNWEAPLKCPHLGWQSRIENGGWRHVGQIALQLQAAMDARRRAKKEGKPK